MISKITKEIRSQLLDSTESISDVTSKGPQSLRSAVQRGDKNAVERILEQNPEWVSAFKILTFCHRTLFFEYFSLNPIMHYSWGCASTPLKFSSAVFMRSFACGYEDTAGGSFPWNSVLCDDCKKVITKIAGKFDAYVNDA